MLDQSVGLQDGVAVGSLFCRLPRRFPALIITPRVCGRAGGLYGLSGALDSLVMLARVKRTEPDRRPAVTPRS